VIGEIILPDFFNEAKILTYFWILSTRFSADGLTFCNEKKSQKLKQCVKSVIVMLECMLTCLVIRRSSSYQSSSSSEVSLGGRQRMRPVYTVFSYHKDSFRSGCTNLR